MAQTNEVIHILTAAEAISFVKKVDHTNSGKFCLSVRLDAAVQGDPDKVFPDGLFHYLPLSRAQALELVSNMLRPTLEERGARITIREVHHRGIVGYDNRPTYWIS